MLRGTDVMDVSGAMARGNRHQQAGVLSRFWIQVAVSILSLVLNKPPHGGCFQN
jgi:hypothetical protein